MAKIDAYLRSLDKFGAHALLLQSNQSVTLRFPAGDRQATQTTTHEQLVALVREVAPPTALDSIDGGRPARFAMQSGGTSYLVSVSPRPDRWSVQVESAVAAQTQPLATIARPPAAPEAPAAPADEMLIERTAHEARGAGSWLDELVRVARGQSATDLHLVPGTRPVARAGGALIAIGDAAAIDGEQLVRELETALPGAVEDADEGRARAHIHVVDGAARCRVHIFRDRHGVGAAVRLHPLEAPDPRRLAIPDAALALGARRRGLVLVASPSGGGRTTTIAALIEAAASRAARVISIERAAEIVHAHRRGLVSQRVIGEHVASVAAGLTAIADEDADVVAVHDLPDAAAVAAALQLAIGGRLVLAGVAAPTASDAIEHALASTSGARLAQGLAGAIAQTLCRRGQGAGVVAAFEVLLATEPVLAAVRQGSAHQIPALVASGRAQGMIAMASSLAELVRSHAIAADEAAARAPDPADLRALLGA